MRAHNRPNVTSGCLERDLRYAASQRLWERRGTEPGQLKDNPKRPCKLRLTSKRRQPQTIVVRCECMADTRSKPKPSFYGYDSIGEYDNIDDALAAWRSHQEAVKV